MHLLTCPVHLAMCEILAIWVRQVSSKTRQPSRPSKLGCARLCLLWFGGSGWQRQPTASPALHQDCGLCRELGCLAQSPHPLPDCSRSHPGIHCPPCGACGEAAIFISSLSLPLGPGPRTGWYSFGNTPWFHASLLKVTVERQKMGHKSKTSPFPKCKSVYRNSLWCICMSLLHESIEWTPVIYCTQEMHLLGASPPLPSRYRFSKAERRN